LDDIHGSQQSAERCLQVVADNNMSGKDIRQLSPRVWRWVSACERYFGITLSMIIKEDGQDPALQNELRLAALRHFTLATQFGVQANKEALVIAAAGSAWNVSIPLIAAAGVRGSLMTLQRQILTNLAFCKVDQRANDLRLQFFLAMIEELSQDKRWDQASEVVMEVKHMSIGYMPLATPSSLPYALLRLATGLREDPCQAAEASLAVAHCRYEQARQECVGRHTEAQGRRRRSPGNY